MINIHMSAFPTPGLSGLPNGDCIYPEGGMELRDYFATKAMQAILIDDPMHDNFCTVRAYKIADKMMAAREL